MSTEPAVELIEVPDGEGRAMWPIPHPTGRLLAVRVPATDTEPESLVVVDAVCPHRGGPLIEGRIRDGAIVCPWHWYAFDLLTGVCRTAAEADLVRHPVTVRDGRYWVEVTARPTESWSQLLRRHAGGG